MESDSQSLGPPLRTHGHVRSLSDASGSKKNNIHARKPSDESRNSRKASDETKGPKKSTPPNGATRLILRTKRRSKRESRQHETTDSDDTDEASSMESEHTDSQDSKSSPAKVPQHKLRSKESSEWEILEGLKDGQHFDEKPGRHEGFMMKRRKWPMKGWHKRYFVIENGILTYAKSPSDLAKGKYHGSVDIGLSFLTYKRERRRIDIDAEDLIYHIKVKVVRQFDEWIRKLRAHRLYRQHILAYGSKEVPRLTDVQSPVEDFSTPVTSPVTPEQVAIAFAERTVSRGSFKSRTPDRSQSKVAAWLLDSNGMQQYNKELQAAQSKIYDLGNILEKLEQFPVLYSDNVFEFQELSKKDKAKKEKAAKALKKKSQDKLVVPNGSQENGRPIHLSTSNPNLITMDPGEKTRPISAPENLLASGHDLRIQEMKLRDDFNTNARAVHESLNGLYRTINTERERLKHALEQDSGPLAPANNAYIQHLKQTLTETLKQNEDYRVRLTRIYNESNVFAGTSRHPTPIPDYREKSNTLTSDPSKHEHPLQAASGSWESQSVQDFYDAEEYLNSSIDSSEGSEDEEENSSDISDTENTAVPTVDEFNMELKSLNTGRRSRLPVPKPELEISLWSLLCKNIGKDLSKISMPVTLNEPLSMLQRLCEELEYSELLDKASEIDDPYERMVYIAAFSVSAYASTYFRAGQKPFNPLLGETYECIREDKGWRFVSEQVSHHPPISACYSDSRNFQFWQDMRIKTKFWGKSMEIQPVGQVHCKLPKHKDHYTWNKATTCVHNLLGGQRWVDHYGEVNIVNHGNGVKCKLTYAKSSYWNAKRHEVYGAITTPEGKVIHQIFGKWNEGIYYGHAPSAKCVWRPGSMPEDYDLYYGFTRFAIELNEIDGEQAHLYPPTDTRFRVDQRRLEEGKIQEAENEKLRMEQMQRERRRKREDEKAKYSPKWFMKSEDTNGDVYMYTGKYWDLRKDPGFLKMSFDKLW